MRLFRLVIVLVLAIVVLPVGMVLAQEPNPTRVLPDTVEQGGTFNVTVNFTAPANNFTAIILTDIAPDGWNVTAKTIWCQPAPSWEKVTGSKVEVFWQGPYNNVTNFTVLYQVTIYPGNASGTYNFTGVLSYYIGPSEQKYQSVAGDSQVEIIPPAICFSPVSINFYGAVNGTNPQNRTLELWSSTPCPLNWSLSDDADYIGHDWLSESPTNGSCTNVSSSVAVSVNTSGMPEGEYFANITINSTEANNSPRIVPVTLLITNKGILKGQVGFSRQQPKGNSTWETGLVVRFFDNATKVEMGWSPINVTTDAYGNFTIEDVYPGTYDIGIKNWTSLSEMNMSVAFTTANITMVNFGTMREGDTDDNDHVAYADYVNLLLHYDKVYASADFDRSGKVGYSDYISLLLNYDKKGDVRLYTA